MPSNSDQSEAMRSEIAQGLLDALPFTISLMLSFTMIGILCYSQELGLAHSMLFSGMLMSSPLQMTLLQAAQQTLSFMTVVVSALSINLRFVVFTLSLRSSMQKNITAYIPAILIMANAAFTLMTIRRQNHQLTHRYCNTVSFILWFTALAGTSFGYYFSYKVGNGTDNEISVLVAIFLASTLGKMARIRTQLCAQISTATICFFTLWSAGSLNLMLILTITLVVSFVYDRG